MSRVIIIAALAASTLSLPAQDRVDFEKQVWPILQKNCVECHRAAYKDDRGFLRRPKAGLRLDGRAWIEKGSDGEKVVHPGKPDDSLLYILTTLEPSEDGFMPDKGEKLPKASLAILERWIKEGCDFGEWTGAPGPGAPAGPVAHAVPSAVKELREIAGSIAPASRGAIEKAARDAHARIVPAAPGSPLLRVTFSSFENEVRDKQVAALAPLQGHITHLVLGRTLITDRALATVARMKRLTRLDVRETDVTDRGVARLKGLKELRYLNLFGTDVTDKGLAAVAELPNLRSLYVWQTKVTEDAIAGLRQKRPTTRISFDLPLPEPPAETGNRRGRRRRRND